MRIQLVTAIPVETETVAGLSSIRLVPADNFCHAPESTEEIGHGRRQVDQQSVLVTWRITVAEQHRSEMVRILLSGFLDRQMGQETTVPEGP